MTSIIIKKPQKHNQSIIRKALIIADAAEVLNREIKPVNNKMRETVKAIKQ